MLNVALDIDGVIVDFVSSFMITVKERLGYDLRYEDIYCHEITQVMGLPKKQVNELLADTLHRNVFQLIPGAKEAIIRLSKTHHVFIITGRSEEFRHNTESLLQHHGIPHESLYFSEYLQKHMVETHFDVFVEDSLEEALSLTERGGLILLYDHPWNSRTLNVKNIVRRVKTWDDIEREIADLERIRGKSLNQS